MALLGLSSPPLPCCRLPRRGHSSALHHGSSASQFAVVQWQRRQPGTRVARPRSGYGKRGDGAVGSGLWRGGCRAMGSNSEEVVIPPPAWTSNQPQVWYFAVANAQSLMLEGAPLESVLQDGIERAERAKRPRDVWLIMEPAFLSDHPGLKALNARLTKPTAAILSTNGDWMLSFVKQSLPQATIGKFLSPSTAVPDPLKSILNTQGAVIGGGGVWH